ncbi:hypothetical protein fh0823_04830 [Francisella halioticida]|uniref:DUF1311 domain-containing protein n=1 Tax=Francisella halioticida TaxID=549298 RepID=A0ABM6LYN3_9GAMM|nr:hypothetical protein [Francisella halioticida]ASG67741.1 hypothetical protein CDV26_04470 [Francisella halioticida]BCD90344.1 hypothetical protein fh0823_04830 [Francisella halioticida]
MKKLLLIIFAIFPIIIFADTICDGNTYEINKCLKSQMQKLDSKLDNIQNHNIKNFKKYRNKICSDISATYNGGSYESVKYGNCIISMDRWFLRQLQK